MATIIKNPDVEDYFVELTLAEIKSRPNGITDLFEANRLILLKDYRIPVDLNAFSKIYGDRSKIEDPSVARTIKKMTSPSFFAGARPKLISNDTEGFGVCSRLAQQQPLMR